MQPSPGITPGPPGTPSVRRRPPAGVIAAAALLILVLVIGLIVVFAGGDDSDSASQTPAAGPTEDISDLPDQTIPQTAPPGIRWESYEGVLLPYSAVAGPREIDGPIARGFERSPTGALLASQHIGTRHFVTPDNGWLVVTEQQVLPGPGRDAYIAARSGVGDEPPAGGFGQTAGFRFVTYSPDIAVIQIVSRFPSTGNLQLVTETVKWHDGDWRLELQPEGGTSPGAQRVSSLDGFVRWGGI